jgi:hypothetical protein
MNEPKLTIEQAYRAMFYFLEQEYEYTHADEIAGLLGSMSWVITCGNGPADPGEWEDWIKAVQKSFREKDNAAPLGFEWEEYIQKILKK